MKYSKDYIKHYKMSEIGAKRFDKQIPARCTQHDVVKNAYAVSEDGVRCIVCKYYCLALTEEKCFDCLMTEDLDNFEPQEVLLEDKKWERYFDVWQKRKKIDSKK